MDIFVTYQDVNESSIAYAYSKGLVVISSFQGYRTFMHNLRKIDDANLDQFRELINKANNFSIYLGNLHNTNQYAQYTEIIIKNLQAFVNHHMAITIFGCDCDFDKKVALAEELKVDIKKCTCGGSDIINKLIEH